MNIKNTLLVYALRLAIWILEKLIARISETKSTDGSKEPGCDGKTADYGEDVLINPDTAKRFSDFIKRHTIPEKTADGESNGNAEAKESGNA